MGTESYSLGMARLYWSAYPGGTAATTVDSIVSAVQAGAAGAYDLGNVVSAEITPDITYLDHFVSVAGARQKDKTSAITKSISIPITFDEINATNVSNFFFTGDVLSATRYGVFNSDTIPPEGGAVLVFYTDTGKDFLYAMPKAALRTEGGALSFNIEDWMSMPFTLEVLHYSSYTPPSCATTCEYGYLDLCATSYAATGV